MVVYQQLRSHPVDISRVLVPHNDLPLRHRAPDAAPLAVAIRRGAGAGPAIDEGPGIRGIPQDPGDPIERRRPPHRLTEPIALRHAEVPAGEASHHLADRALL